MSYSKGQVFDLELDRDSILRVVDFRLEKTNEYTWKDYATRSFYHLRDGDCKEALRDLEQAFEIIDTAIDGQLYVQKALILRCLNEKEEAVVALESIDIYTAEFSVFESASNIAADLEEWGLAIRFTDLCLSFNDTSWNAHYVKGLSLSNINADDSLAYYHLKTSLTLIRKYPAHSEMAMVANGLAYFFLKREKWDSAVIYLHYSLDSLGFPLEDDFNVAFKLGVCYFYLGDYEHAIKYLKKQTNKEEYYNALYFNARSLEHLGRAKQAIPIYSIIIEDEDQENESLAIVHRGFCFYNTGDFLKAIEDLDEAISNEYNKAPKVYFYLALSYVQVNNKDKACKTIRNGLKKCGRIGTEQREFYQRLSELDLEC
ncbi:MAG: hypothetical protein NXI09_15760 [Bacteroidetes bacterium]|nr:hypothetical protein [Bacteroidota bacterium]